MNCLLGQYYHLACGQNYVLCQHNFNVHISKSIVNKVMQYDVIIYLAYSGLKYTTIALEIEMHENLLVYA